MDDRWWTKDVSRVIAEADIFYARLAEVAPLKTKLALTKEKIISIRKWAPTLSMYRDNFDVVLQQLDFFYIPNRIIPGPAFCFPIRDVDGKYTCAQTKPIEGSVLFGDSKYRFIGDRSIGPRWLGNDYATLKRIIDTHKVMVVEGAFDILAARLLCPDAPILSPLTKRLGKDHLAYLRMLGVNNLVLMYDNEMAKKGKREGAGNMSMKQQMMDIKGMEVSSILCPKSDPSTCLEDLDYTEKLKDYIMREF